MFTAFENGSRLNERVKVMKSLLERLRLMRVILVVNVRGNVAGVLAV